MTERDPIPAEDSSVTPPINSFARFVLHSEYRRIALEHLEIVEDCEKRRSRIVVPDRLIHEITDAAELDAISEADELEELAQHPMLIAIVFAAMYLEAFIYDYACLHAGETHAERYLDRLDPIGKWIVIPRLVTGAELDDSSHVFEAMKRLFTVRNRLVHYKSAKLAGRKHIEEELEELELEEQEEFEAVMLLEELAVVKQLEQRQKQYEIETRMIRVAVTEPIKLLKKLHADADIVWYHTDFT